MNIKKLLGIATLALAPLGAFACNVEEPTDSDEVVDETAVESDDQLGSDTQAIEETRWDCRDPGNNILYPTYARCDVVCAAVCVPKLWCGAGVQCP